MSESEETHPILSEMTERASPSPHSSTPTQKPPLLRDEFGKFVSTSSSGKPRKRTDKTPVPLSETSPLHIKEKEKKPSRSKPVPSFAEFEEQLLSSGRIFDGFDQRFDSRFDQAFERMIPKLLQVCHPGASAPADPPAGSGPLSAPSDLMTGAVVSDSGLTATVSGPGPARSVLDPGWVQGSEAVPSRSTYDGFGVPAGVARPSSLDGSPSASRTLPRSGLSAAGSHPDPHGLAPTGVFAVPHDPAGSDLVQPIDAMEIDSDSVLTSDRGIPVVQDPEASHGLSSFTRYRDFAGRTYPEVARVVTRYDADDHTSVGSLSRPSVTFGVKPPAVLSREWDRQLQVWREEGAMTRLSRLNSRPRPSFFLPPFPGEWPDTLFKVSENEKTFLGMGDSVTMSASTFRTVQSAANDMVKLAGYLSTVLGPCTSALGHLTDTDRPESFVFEDEADPSMVGLQLSSLSDIAKDIRRCAVDNRLRLEAAARACALSSKKNEFEPSELNSLMSADLVPNSLFDPSTFSEAVKAVRERQKDVCQQEFFKQAVKRQKVEKPKPTFKVPVQTASYPPSRGQPSRGRGRGRGRGQATRGGRGASASATSGSKATMPPQQSFH